ncbi:hypothetical protein L198_03075 [Cryptococcus wingfieldii CBS 7118]|uniref:Actin-like ATPase domain-containing protein n=1 Tax=Cryptococcus wingfieldii CBS 7118 TaxID=1295528 RepID=A0A1E3JIS1_9TREE|nr:hypothetical protein L198_03075 [Cryptococcus wingfieldii CBS 7118]ODO00748.1 hypothetical protein L198_03075 [Cryptococcus wingfieldii CBS 7118]
MAFTTPTKTPTKRPAFAAEAGVGKPRPTGASPAYSSRRHSLYGIEDRVVLDLGSRTWKVGFSGEPDPRAVFFARGSSIRDQSSEAWDLDLDSVNAIRGSRSEGDRLIGIRIVERLREIFAKHLLADSKQRKVIVAENTFLPTYLKEHIARTLFDNLRVPSVAFTPSSLLALGSCGRITGLVVDVGWLETSITSVYNSRPLFSLSRSTPLAGRKLHTRVRSLLHIYGSYIAPPKSLGDLSRDRSEGVPLVLLDDAFVEKVVTEGLFVGGVFVEPEDNDDAEMKDPGDIDEAKSENLEDLHLVRSLKGRYQPSSSAKDMTFSVRPPTGVTTMGYGTIMVPGWVRERAAEVLFEDDESDEAEALPHAILSSILKLPVDLRPELISTILLVGGTSSLPNFIPRLRISLLQNLLPAPSLSSDEPPPPPSPIGTLARKLEDAKLWRHRKSQPYQEIYGLFDKVAILNDPAPVDGAGNGKGGRAPRWVPSLMTWVGGSLAGSLRTGGPEMTRETYDTLLSTSLARGEVYREELEEAYASVAASVGASVEDLRVGEAVKDARGLGRRRGWRYGKGVIEDWSQTVKV